MKSDKPNAALLAFASLITCVTWPLAAMLWFRHGERALGISLFGLGLSLGPCLAAYAIVPRARKQKARSVVLFMGGFCIMAFSLLGRVNLDIEGFFMLVFAGTVGAAIGHNLVTGSAATPAGRVPKFARWTLMWHSLRCWAVALPRGTASYASTALMLVLQEP